MNRRDALSALAASLAIQTLPVQAQQRIDFEALKHVANTLLPRDELTPSASELGIVSEVLIAIDSQPLLYRLIAAGLGWLDQAGGRPFAGLTLEQQQQILAWAEGSDYNQIPGRFFHVLKSMFFEAYFSHPGALEGLALNEAPQPEGYLPPWT
ncbi:MAG: gluconate 2-dehydrogenase subunit 3 family protein [Cognatishimia sp.]|uniref:gluconate 2-dehydrogenase subunit 3 family protein n=1 Tax=Cognatishimia sp. TaxID=2211648 RepID=UPI003B8DED0A